MTDSALILEMLAVLLAAIVSALLFEKLKLPTLLGFIVAGAVIGPEGLGVLKDIQRIHWIAELGMVFLLFTIGLEFSFGKIKGIGKIAFLGGFLQIALTAGLALGFAACFGLKASQGFVLGVAVALSSTAVVFRHLMEKAEIDTQHGRVAVALLIFQDIAVAPILALLPLISPSRTEGNSSEALWIGAKVALFLGVMVILSSKVFPKLMKQLALTRSREILLLSVLVLSFGSASVSEALGLSRALGAFFAGVLIANTDYGHQIGGDITPFRQVFVSVFFVSLGLLFDLQFFAQNIPAVMGLSLAVLIVNMIVVTAVVLLFGYPPRVALTAGLFLAQIGEFSFLFLDAARGNGILDDRLHALFFSGAVVTLFVSPLLFRLVEPVGRWTQRHALLGLHPKEQAKEPAAGLENHVVICGFGNTGRDLSGALREEGIPILIIEMNPHHLDAAKKLGYPALYGDAANREVLKKAGILRARAVVVSFGDSSSLQRIAMFAQQLNRDALLIIRTRFEKDAVPLYEAGADGVIIEELEASLELTRSVLTRLELGGEKIRKHESVIRDRKELLIEQGILKKFSKPGLG